MSKTRRALIVYGGWEGHQPKEISRILAERLKANAFDVQLSDSLDSYLDPALADNHLIVQHMTMATIGKEQLKGLLSAVRGGVGLAGVHGGLCDSFRLETEYQFMCGGQWVAHPGNIVDYTVDVMDPTDPVMAGIGTFRMRSEQYYMHVDPSNHVLATTTFTGEHGGADWIGGCVMPAAWKRTYGQGRVFYSSLGHVASDFDVPEVLTIITRGMLWAAR
jgi:type 1 glutamine amidotransferase